MEKDSPLWIFINVMIEMGKCIQHQKTRRSHGRAVVIAS